MTPRSSDKRTWAADLVHPVPLAAVGVLALNDHILKGSGPLPAVVTGKLSDFAGLFFFPLLLASIARGLSRATRGRDIQDRRSLAAAVAIITAIGFAAVKLIPAVNALAAVTWGSMAMDDTDLLALPMVGLAVAWMLRATLSRAPAVAPRAPAVGRSDLRRTLDFAAVVAVAIASIASVPAGRGAGASPKSTAQRVEEEEEALDPALIKQAELAQKLLLIDLQTETMAPLFASQEDLKAQHDKLIEHIAFTTTILQGAVADPTSMRAAEVGLDLAGIAYDLMRANREVWSRGLTNRKEIEKEVNYTLTHHVWPAMDKLKADFKWAQVGAAEANELIASAVSHRDNLLEAASAASIMGAGVQAASIVNLAVTVPSTVVAGYRALGRIGEWMAGLQIETASLRFAGVPGGVGTFQIVSTAAVLDLGLREVTYLAEAGKVSVTALDLYIMAKSGGPPPGASKYRARYNAARAAEGKPQLPDGWQAHHRIPQVYRNHPEFKGFDFDAPENIRGVKGPDTGENIHQQLTNLWKEFRKANPNATRQQIEDFARSIDSKFQSNWWK